MTVLPEIGGNHWLQNGNGKITPDIDFRGGKHSLADHPL